MMGRERVGGFGALSRPVSSFVYDAECSYDDYYQTDSVKVCVADEPFYMCVNYTKITHLDLDN
jgi:hypothetical protein